MHVLVTIIINYYREKFQLKIDISKWLSKAKRRALKESEARGADVVFTSSHNILIF